MRHYIVEENPFDIKMMLAKRTQHNVTSFILGIIIFHILWSWIPTILSKLIPGNYQDMLLKLYQNGSNNVRIINKIYSNFPEISVAAFLYILLIGGALLLGRCIYTMHYINTLRAEYGKLAGGFSFYFKALLLYLLENFFITLWFFLLIIPAIPAFYSYRQAFYLLADDPSKGVMQCIRESKILMHGNKMNLFRLDLSYLLLIILLSIPEGIAAASINMKTWSGTIIYLICCIPQYIGYASAYLGQCQFFFLLKEGTMRLQDENVNGVNQTYATESSIHKSVTSAEDSGMNDLASGVKEIVSSDDGEIRGKVAASVYMDMNELLNVARMLEIPIRETYTKQDIVNMINEKLSK